jgi:hypothetical protein
MLPRTGPHSYGSRALARLTCMATPAGGCPPTRPRPLSRIAAPEGLRLTAVMVDEEHLKIFKQPAGHEGRPGRKYVREALRSAAPRARRRPGDEDTITPSMYTSIWYIR